MEIEYIRSITTPAAYVVGHYDPMRDYDYGDVVIRESSVLIYDGRNWQELGDHAHMNTHTEEEIFFRCVSCGAPTNHDGVCPYCGTINRKVRSIT